MNALQQQTYDFFLFLCQATGIDIQALIVAQKSDPTTLGIYIQRRELFNIFKLYSRGEYNRAINACADFLKECISNARINEFTEESLKETGRFFLESAKWIAFYEQFKATDRAEWLNIVKSIPLLTSQELTGSEIENTDRRDLSAIENTMKHINLRRYSGLGVIPPKFQAIVVNDSFVMCDNLTTLLSGLKPQADDYVHITIMLKLDCHSWMSYFIVAIQYKENTWIADDGYSFANPRAKEGIALRGSARVREENLNSSILPYQWVLWADEERKKCRSLINKSIHIKELYIKQITHDWETRDKILTYLLFEKLIDRVLLDSPIAIVSTFATLATSNSHLLADNQFELIITRADLSKEFECSHLHNQCESYLHDLYVPQKETKPIVHICTSTIINQLDGSNTLCSEKQYREQVAWFLKDQERVQLQTALNNLSLKLEEQLSELVSMVERNLPNIYPYLFSGETVYYDSGESEYRSFGSHSTQRTIYPFSGGQWLSDSKTIGKDKCPCCGNHPSNKKNHFSLNVFHYRQLMWLCGVSDRSALPPYYRNFRVHDQLPYSGNFLLNNINPTYTVKDPCSDRHPNGFGITFCLCGYCLNRLLKQYLQGEETRVHISLTELHVTNVELIK